MKVALNEKDFTRLPITSESGINEGDKLIYIADNGSRINAIYLATIDETQCLLWVYTTSSGLKLKANRTKIRKEPWWL
ncbi:MAG: hypothetical protein JSS78_02160 [Bacteroidetes bacterium]|nr:hypothetical protein [Bacteroidota bacterium]